jgi:ABC-type polysaccharide/polyol phosphate transport system ATPase subunit
MSAAVQIEKLGKVYSLRHASGRNQTFQELLKGLVARPFRWLRGGAGRAAASEPFWALRDVSFDIEQGDVVGIIGRNGAGKSTLLKILSRIVEPTEGQATLRGRVSSLLEVGTGFHPELSGRENIYLNGSILGMRKREIDARFDDIVEFAEVEQFLDTPVKRYSSGMYVRLAFAVAAHLNPEILIVDEVLAVGDAEFQRKCLGKMREVSASRGRTVVFVSHNMDAVSALCGKAVWLAKGAVAMRGPTQDVVRAYMQAASKADPEVRVRSNRLQYVGIENGAGLDALGADADLAFTLAYRTGSDALDNVEFDCAVVNEREQFVLHCRSRYVDRRFALAANADVTVRFEVARPNLGPGNYTLVAYAACGGEVLSLVEQIPLGNVSARSRHGEFGVIEGFRGAVLPKFGVEASARRRGS